MSRKEELQGLIGNELKELTEELVDQIIFLEEKLEEFKKLPFIRVNPNNPMQQKATPAGKMYKEFLQQYINAIKMIENIVYQEKRLKGEEIEDSPLRKWAKDYEQNMDTR